MMLGLYRGLTTALGPLILVYLAHRRRKGKEDPARFGERRGVAAAPRPDGRLVWLHAASVGEAVSTLPLVERLRRERPGTSVLVTTGTVTSARLLASRLPRDGRTLHQFVPVDRPAYVRRFLDHWRPDLAIWIESELWPTLLTETQRRGVPMLLLNARMSARSFERWRRFPAFARTVLGGFALCLAQDERQAERLRALGVPEAASVGDLKAAAPPLPADEAELDRLARAVAGRPLWLAASTHPGEEEAAAAAHRALAAAAAHPGLLTIVAPRHPSRGDAIAAMLRESGLRVARRSRGEEIAPDTDVYLADTMGEMGLFYRLAGIVFVGASLTPKGGHNPLEPAQLDCAILHGPDMSNCAAVARALDEAGAAVAVADANALAAEIDRLLREPAERTRRAEAALAVAARHRGVLDAVFARIAPFLDAPSPPPLDGAAPDRTGTAAAVAESGRHARA
jgi:3-deoxy-D-manno-octulosonic-acid transferase